MMENEQDYAYGLQQVADSCFSQPLDYNIIIFTISTHSLHTVHVLTFEQMGFPIF